MKSFIQDTTRLLSPDPRPILTGSKKINDLTTNISSVTNPVVCPVLETILPKNVLTGPVINHPVMVDDANNQKLVHLALEQLKIVDLTYLSLFRKNSRFSNKGFTHFFLSQELDTNDTNIYNINNDNNSVFNSGHDTSSLASSNNHSQNRSELNEDADSKRSPTPDNNSTSIIDSHAIYNLSFTPDGKYLASAGEDGLIRIWEVITSEMDRHDGPSTIDSCLATDPNVLNIPVKQHRKSFIDTAFDETMTDLNSLLRTGSRSNDNLKPRKNTVNSHDSNYSAGIGNSLNNSTAAVNNNNNNNNKLKTNIYAPVFKSKPVKTFYHDKTINSLDWSKNNFLLSSSEDCTVKLWHVDRADCLQTYKFDSIITCSKFHKTDDRFIIVSQWNGRIVLISILEKEIIYEINLNKLITCMEFSPDGKRFFVGCDKGYIYSLKIVNNGFEIESDYHFKKKMPRITGITTLMDNVLNNSECNQPIEQTLKILISTNDSNVRLINYEGRFLEVTYSGHSNKSSSIFASSNEDNSYVISGSEDGWTYFWQIYADKRNKIENEKKIFNKAHFDILKFFKDDKSIIENKYYGAFHTNSTRCNSAIFAPRASLKLLELSNDPIFDLKHQYSFALKESHIKDLEIDDLSTSIIITADNSGKIKVFRRDFSHYIRKAIQSKKSATIIEKRRQTMNQSINHNVLNKNSLIIPNYEASRMNITDTMASVYSDNNNNYDYDNNLRGRQDNKGILKPANKFAVESTISRTTTSDSSNSIQKSYDSNGNHLSSNKLPSLPMINIIEHDHPKGREIMDSKNTTIDGIDNISSNMNARTKNKENLKDSSDNVSLNSVQISDSVKNIDDELKNILLNTPKLGEVHDIKQNQHSTSSNTSLNQTETNATATTFKCSNCQNSDFNARPMTSGDTNKIRFFCNVCGQEAHM